jgi:hypothetical protein
MKTYKENMKKAVGKTGGFLFGAPGRAHPLGLVKIRLI